MLEFILCSLPPLNSDLLKVLSSVCKEVQITILQFLFFEVRLAESVTPNSLSVVENAILQFLFFEVRQGESDMPSSLRLSPMFLP